MTITVQLWSGELSSDSADIQRYWSSLAADEQHHVQQLKSPALQSRYSQSHGLLRMQLAEQLNETAAAIRIAKGDHGKPYLVDYPMLSFNVSHSANQLVMAFAENCQLGVDLECYRSRSNFTGLVGKCFAAEEAAYWHCLPESEQQRAFYQFWTAKEALVKATGRGIALGLQHCVLSTDEPRHFLSVPAECGAASAWRLHALDLNPMVCATLVIDQEKITLKTLDNMSS